jgi:hypothetical protein
LAANQLDPRYKSGTTFDVAKIDAPRLLMDLFLALSGNRLEYHKTTHSPELVDWLLDHDPAALLEVVDLLKAVLPATPVA